MMAHRVLDRLLSVPFQASMTFAPTPTALHRMLERSPEVRKIQRGLQRGEITEATIEQFVASLMKGLKQGERFQDEVPLAALAVALQSRSSPFADSFLHQLAGLKLAEMSTCVRVARECLDQRVHVAKSKAALELAGQAPGEPVILSYEDLVRKYPPSQATHRCGV
jgi:hypothetical protein